MYELSYGYYCMALTLFNPQFFPKKVINGKELQFARVKRTVSEDNT